MTSHYGTAHRKNCSCVVCIKKRAEAERVENAIAELEGEWQPLEHICETARVRVRFIPADLLGLFDYDVKAGQ